MIPVCPLGVIKETGVIPMVKPAAAKLVDETEKKSNKQGAA
jgi:hypothetical protein